MLPRYRSVYGKFIVLVLVALCFLLYIKVLNVEHTIDTLAAAGDNNERQQPRQLRQRQHWDVSENEIPQGSTFHYADMRNKAWQQPDTESPYELSVRLDLQKQQAGLGDDGESAQLSGEAKQRGDEIYKKIALNEELSEHISYNRTLADSRHPECARLVYDVPSLPSASVIIIFYNEPYSVLMRTVHSTLNTCNSHLLKEIILVDDGSSNVELHGKLDYYVNTHIPSGKVKVLHLKNR